ncbi:MAG: thioredoxin-dependent thiol peroxidase [Acidimicrobiaceae bacterium]|nr:thioredoxin-dependent thiol peroxidase [Acidimicrobiaceae bacterium]
MARLEVGAKAPQFSLANQDGDMVKLQDLIGQRFVLYFYPADDTPGCTKEACQFTDSHSSFDALDVKVFGVSPDDATRHVAFRKKYDLNFDLLSDPQKKVMAKYGAFGEKMMYGKKVLGVIRSTFVIGPSGTIEHAWYNVRADGHAAKVLATIHP